MKYLLFTLVLILLASKTLAQFNGTCGGIPATNNTVCTGRGSCIALDNCNCTTSFYGANCEAYNCGSVIFNATNVCSGNGTCGAPNNCTCNTGYTGNLCDSYQCNGFNFNSMSVCSGNGTCAGPDNCNCNKGFYGFNCEAFNCFTELFNTTAACSANGTCVSPDQCKCDSPFYGNKCDQFNCFGVNFNLSSTCNGNGKCSKPDSCSCNTGYTGPQCNLFNCSGLVYDATKTTAQFTNNYLAINFNFLAAMESSAIAACNSGVSNVVSNAAVLGTGATCEFTSQSTMRIVLGTNPTIKDNGVVTYITGKMKVRGCAVVLGGNVVAKAAAPVSAFSSIKAPTSVSSCGTSSLVMDGSSSSGANSVRFGWSMVQGAGLQYSAAVDTKLKALTVNRAILTNGELPVGKMRFQLQVTDYISQTATTTVDITKTASNDQISVLIGRFAQDLTKINLPTALVASVSRTACTTGVTTLTYAWSSTSHTSLAITGKNRATALITPYTLKAGVKYTFQVVVELKRGTTVLATDTSSYSVTGSAGPLLAAIAPAGVTSLTFRGDQRLVLDGSLSRDFNDVNGTNANATYRWACCEVDSATSVCDFPKCAQKFPTLANVTANMYVRQGTTGAPLPTGNFRFVLTYADSPRVSTALKIVSIVPAGSPTLNYVLQFVNCRRLRLLVTSANVGTTVNYTETVTSGAVTVIGKQITGSQVFYELDTTNTKSTTTIRVSGTAGSNTAVTNVVIGVSEKPSGGSVIITNSNGAEITGSLAGNTEYNLVVKQFSTPSGSTVFSRAKITFMSAGGSMSVLEFATSASTRTFTTPIDVTNTLNATAEVTLFTTQLCSNAISTKNFGVNKFTLPQGQTLDTIAEAKAGSVLTEAITTGTPSDVSNAASDILSILRQSSGGNATARAGLKATVVNSYKAAILTVTVVTSETQSAGASIIADALVSVAEITTSSRADATAVFAKLFTRNSNEGVEPAVANSALNSCGSLFDSLVFVAQNNTGNATAVVKETAELLNIDAVNPSELTNIQNVAKNVVVQALVLKNIGQSFATIKTNFRVTGSKLPTNMIPTSVTPFTDGSFVIKPTITVPNVIPVVNVLFYHYRKGLYDYVTDFSKMTTDVYGVEIINDQDKQTIPITSNTAVAEYAVNSTTTTTTASTNECRVYATNNQFTPTGASFVSAVAKTSITCRSNSVGLYAAFSKTATTTQPQPQPTNQLSGGVAVETGSIMFITLFVLCIFQLF